MIRSQKKEILQKINEAIEQTKSSIFAYEDMTRAIAPENSIGRISRMDAIHNKSITESALREAKLKLKNLLVMKSNIDEKSFGLCAKCSSPIPIARLLYMPQSRYCVHCAR